MNKAIAKIKGSDRFPKLEGSVTLCEMVDGVHVTARIFNLPKGNSVFGFHIHQGESCTGNSDDPFGDTGAHYNPDNYPHPYHRGDMPPLFSNSGSAVMSFVTDRFSLGEVLGKAVIIHSMPDDFTTQPSGNAGEKIACGIICMCKC